MYINSDFWRDKLRKFDPDNLSDDILITFIRNNIIHLPPNDYNYNPLVCVIFNQEVHKRMLFERLFKYLQKYYYNFPVDDILFWYYSELHGQLGSVSYEFKILLNGINVTIKNHSNKLIYIFLHGLNYKVTFMSYGFDRIGIKTSFYSTEIEINDDCKIIRLATIKNNIINKSYVIENDVDHTVVTQHFLPFRILAPLDENNYNIDLGLKYPLKYSEVRDGEELNNLYLNIGEDTVNRIKFIDSVQSITWLKNIKLLGINEYTYLFKDVVNIHERYF